MARKTWEKVALVIAALAVLMALDGIVSLQGLPVLVILLGAALLVTERLRIWLHTHERAGIALLPFMAAALVLMLTFAKGRDVSQGVLLVVTLGLVFDILLVALALISEVSKRGLRGIMEFVGLTAMGLLLGFGLSLVFLLPMGRLGGASLASP